MYTLQRLFVICLILGPILPDAMNAKTNETVIWTWNAVRNGSVYDCRLCLPTRPQSIWDSCNKQCSNVPSDLLEMKRFMEEKRKKRLDDAIKWVRHMIKNDAYAFL